jgi:hypothetical protein
METPAPDVFSNTFGDVAYMASTKMSNDSQQGVANQKGYVDEVRRASLATIEKLTSQKIPSEDDAKRSAMLAGPDEIGAIQDKSRQTAERISENQIYSFRVEFSGFLFSLVDSTPSEIAVVSLKNFNALARWDSFRTSDASLIASIGWLQVDNHVPSAPFKVVVRPDTRRVSTEPGNNQDSPLLVVGLAFAPKHKSGIMVSLAFFEAPSCDL